MQNIYDMLILGGGPGGYTAALYAARAGLRALVIEPRGAGGQMALTDRIDNYPGFDAGVEGFTLGQRMRAGAERFGACTVCAQAVDAELAGEVKAVRTDAGTFWGRTVVIATGADPRRLGLPEEARFTGRGVSYCATCDGMFFRGRRVAVVGGGNSAAEEALVLSRIARHVTLIHRRASLRASNVLQSALRAAENVEFIPNAAVTSLRGGEMLGGITLTDSVTGEEKEHACDGLFVSIGREPVTDFLGGQLETEDGYLVADETTRTRIPGVFAVGDVRTKAVRQIVTATADGAAAACFAEQYLAHRIRGSAAQ